MSLAMLKNINSLMRLDKNCSVPSHKMATRRVGGNYILCEKHQVSKQFCCNSRFSRVGIVLKALLNGFRERAKLVLTLELKTDSIESHQAFAHEFSSFSMKEGQKIINE